MQKIIEKLAIGAAIIWGLLMIPLIAQWPWTSGDFMFAFVILFGAECAYVLVSQKNNNSAYKWAVGIAVVASLLLVWINLAVGIIGDEDRPANVLFFAVLLIGFIGAIISQLKARGMSRTLFAMAAAQALVPVIAYFAWRPHVVGEEPGVIGVFVLCWFFAGLYGLSGSLFRRASEEGVAELTK